MSALASRLYRNKEIRELAEQDAMRRAEMEKEDANLASASRSQPPQSSSEAAQQGGRGKGRGGKGTVSMPEEFESDRQFYEWMEVKRKVRTREREERQEDEIWGIARVYFVVAVVIIALALASTLGR